MEYELIEHAQKSIHFKIIIFKLHLQPFSEYSHALVVWLYRVDSSTNPVGKHIKITYRKSIVTHIISFNSKPLLFILPVGLLSLS